jgi:hypothetical protein
MHAVASRETDPDMLGLFQLIVAAALFAGRGAWADAD